MIRFEVNETAQGIVAPPKEICKVKGCEAKRFKTRKGHAFCKKHSGLKGQMPRAKFKELIGNNELVIAPDKPKKKGLKTTVVRDGKEVTVYVTSKKKKWKVIKNQLLGMK